jgi:hypothetical protein
MTISLFARGQAGLVAIATALLSACACAQPNDRPPPPPPPPAEAFAACKAAPAGAACSFSAPQGMVSGSCWAPEGKPLACKPKSAPAGATSAPKP